MVVKMMEKSQNYWQESVPKIIIKERNKNENVMDVFRAKTQFLKEYRKLLRRKIGKKNKELIRKYIELRKASGISYVQLLKDVFSIKQFFQICKKDFDLVGVDDLQKFLISMNNLKPKSKEIRWFCIKKFLEFVGKKELFSKFSVKFESNSKILPEEILTEEEVEKIINSAQSLRDKTFLAILYESGMRAGEILTRKVKDISFDERGAKILIDGKTGRRIVRICKFSNLLKEFISNKSPEERIFNFTYSNASRILKETCMIAGINKKVRLHLMRHSRATHLANFLTESQLKAFFGWSQGSRMASVYVHLTGKDIDDAILKASGIFSDENRKKNLDYIG